MKKSTEGVRRFVTQVASYQGWGLNRDESFLADLIEGLKTNYNRYGYYLCPCRDGAGERPHDRDIICPCDYNVPDQKEYGHCYCALFFDPEFLAAGREPRPIPERRPEELQTEW